MKALNTLKTRLNYVGGNAEQRMIKGKLDSLRKALLYSYQAETAIMPDGKEFRCLINPDKNSGNYDNKILSIPYEDICLNEEIGENDTTTKAIQPTNVKPGQVFVWKETGTHWIIYLQYLEENAYFRSQIRRCDQTTVINGVEYWTYIRGPVETALSYNQKGGIEWNDMNHSLEMYITKDENTVTYLKRFATLKVKEEMTGLEKTWQVVAMNPYYGDGIVKVSLDEYFENSIQEAVDAETALSKIEEPPREEGEFYIDGPHEVSPYSKVTYNVYNNFGSGEWFIKINDGEEKSLGKTETEIDLTINEKQGEFILSYKTAYDEAAMTVKISAF